MQGKVLLSILLVFFTTCLLAQGQQVKPVVKNIHPFSTISKDSVIVYKGKDAANQAGKLIAANLPSGKANIAALASDCKKYAHIPLAGEKSYFGDKNEYVNDFVRRYLELHNQTLNCVQTKSPDLFGLIDNLLVEKNMPKELKYLAVIESALNNNAVSRAGAVGPWQLMETTARMMGLEVNSHKDERTDWNKSTNAAIKYLDILYSQMNDWLLVIAAYNSGPVTVQRAIDRTGSRNFWDIKDYLPRETQGHVLAFIATASIFENLSKFISLGTVPLDFSFSKDGESTFKDYATNVPGTVTANPATVKTVTGTPSANVSSKAPLAGAVKRVSAITEEDLKNMYIVRINEPLDFGIISSVTGIDKNLLNRWNPDYDMYVFSTYPTPYYKLKMPKDKTQLFMLKIDEISRKSRAYYSDMK